MTSLSINISNIAANSSTYYFSGYCEIWAVAYPDDNDPPEILGIDTYKRNLGISNIDESGAGNFEFEESELISVEKQNGEAYYYFEVHYYPSTNEIGIVSGTQFVDPDIFYVSKDDLDPTIELDINVLIQNLDPTIFEYQVNFGKGSMSSPLSELKVLGKILNDSDGLLLSLGEMSSNSRGTTLFSWEEITDQAKLSLSYPDYPNESANVITIDTTPKSSDVIIAAATIDDAKEDVITGVDLSGGTNLYTILGIDLTGSDVPAFLTSNSVVSLRDLRKKGGTDNMTGYDALGPSDKIIVQRTMAHARLNLIYFPDDESPDDILKFNDDLYLNKGISSAKDLLSVFTSNTFVVYARTVTPHPSDFRLASIFILGERQVQMSSNLLTAAATDQVYSNGSSAAETVFKDEHPEDCECKDCKSAVSPLSYLASLLSYAEDNVYTVGGDKAKIDELTTYLCQPIEDLPVSCEQSETKICSFRNQIEILYKYGNSSASDCQTRNLRIKKKEYLELVYKFLLEYIGTSYYEIFQAQNQPEKKTALAARIGVVETFNQKNSVERLYFDIDKFSLAGNALTAPYATVISDFETQLEKVFGLAPDSFNPVTDTALTKAEYLSWREEFTKTQWVKQDTPTGYYLEETGHDFYVDPDVVNADDIRYYVDETIASIDYKPIGSTDAYALWENRKLWRESVDFKLNEEFMTNKGINAGENIIRTNLDFNPNLVVLFSGQMTISNSSLNAGTYEMSSLSNWPASSNLGLNLITPLPDASINSGAVIKLEIGDLLGNYDQFTKEITITNPIAGNMSSSIFQLVTSDYSKSILLKGKEGSAPNTIEVELLPGQDLTEIASSFPMGSFVVMTITTSVYDGGGGYDMKDSLSRSGDFLISFKDRTTDLTSGKEFTISGSDNNDGTYEVDSSSTEGMGGTNFNPYGYSFTKINIEKNPSKSGIRSYLDTEIGSGELRYFSSDVTVSSADNGSVLATTANGLLLSAHASLLLKNDKIMMEVETAEFVTYKVASHDQANVQTNNLWLQERVSDPDLEWLQDTGTGPNTVSIIIDPEQNAVSGSTIEIPNRDLTEYNNGYSLTLNVFKKNDYTTAIVVSNVTYNASPSKTIVTVSGTTLDLGTEYVLAIEIDQNSFAQNQSRLVLSSPPSTMLEDLIPGESVLTFDSIPEQIQGLSCSGVSATEIFVNEIIDQPGSILTTNYQIVLALFSQIPNLDANATISAASICIAEVLSNVAYETYFEYTPLPYYSGAPNPVVFNTWTFPTLPLPDLLVTLQNAVKSIENGDNDQTWLDNLHMTKEGLIKFTQIYTEIRAFLANPRTSPKPEPKHIQELLLIVENSIKKALVLKDECWTLEEQDFIVYVKANVDFLADLERIQDPRIFQISTYAPKVLSTEFIIEQNEKSPLIDGQFPLLLKLPESRVGVAASAILSQREEDITKGLESLKYLFASTGFDEFISSVWPQFIDSTVELFFTSVIEALYGTDLNVQLKMEKFIIDDLYMTREEFEALNELRNRWASTNDITVFSEEEVDYVARLLGTSFKQQSIFPFWKQYEADTFNDSVYTESPVWWKVSQVGIKPWVASPTHRIDWVKAISVRWEGVAIEPDLINLRYIKNISDGTQTASYRAYTLYKARNLAIENWQSVTLPTPPPANDLEKYKYLVCFFLGISDAELVGMIEANNLGEDLSSRLRQLYVSNSAFYRIANMYSIVSDTGDLIDADETELLNILVQVKKEKNYCLWKDQEVYAQTNPITISNEYFKEPNLPLTYDSNKYSNSNFQWRFSNKALRKWKRKFQSREMIWDSIAENQNGMLRESDDETLIVLRDAWVDYVGTADTTFEQKAEEVSERLLLDFKNQCCATTTRVSTAISAMQTWYYTLNSETTNPANAEFSLQAPYFDKEWKWLGSYGSFRSAMFVYLYPENLLHPSLRREQSPRFKKIVNQINQGGRFTPETACQLAYDYSYYLKDIENLQPGCSANALVLENVGHCDDKRQAGLKKKFFSFAKGGKTGRVYFSVMDYEEPNQKLINWEELTAFKENELSSLVGTSSYKNIKGERHLYLFAVVKNDGKENLAFIRFNLDENSWEEEYSLLELPDGIRGWKEIRVAQRNGEKRPPLLVYRKVEKVGAWAVSIYCNELNGKGDDWKYEDPIAMTCSGVGPHLIVEGVIEVGLNDSSTYKTSLIVVYKHASTGYLVIQPWVYANPNDHFGNFNYMRPGKFYALSKESSSLLFSPFILSGKNELYVQPASWVKATYKGGYSTSSSDFKFSLIIQEFGASDTKMVELNLQPETEYAGNLGVLHLVRTFAYYFNWNPQYAPMHDEGGETTVLNFLCKINKGFRPRKSGLLGVFRNLFFGAIDGYSSKSKISIVKFLKYSNFKESESKALFDESVHYFFEESLSEYYSNRVDNSEDDPAMLFIYDYFKSFFGNFRLGQSGGSPTSYDDRPTLENIFSVLGHKSGIGLKTGRYINVLLGEMKPNVVSSTNATSGCTELYPNSYLSKTSKQFSLAQKGSQLLIDWFDHDETSFYDKEKDWNLSPYYKSNIPITTNKNSADFQPRRIQIKSLISSNEDDPNITNYQAEAYYFLPVLLGLQLHENGYFEEALAWFRSVYDYQWKPGQDRKIYYGLVSEEKVNKNYGLAPDWLLDPLNPHSIAFTRLEAYTSYTITSIVKCLLDYADQEYTTDTVETVNKATLLYEEAQDLMNLSMFTPNLDPCLCGNDEVNLWKELKCMANIQYLMRFKEEIDELGYLLNEVKDCNEKQTLIDDAKTDYLLNADTDDEIIAGLAEFQTAIEAQVATAPTPISYTSLLSNSGTNTALYFDRLLAVDNYDYVAELTSKLCYEDILETYEQVTGYDATGLDTATLDFLITPYDDPTNPAYDYDQGGAILPDQREEGADVADGFALTNLNYKNYPLASTRNGANFSADYTPMSISYEFCVPFNPVYESHTVRAELNLFKIRNCMNIAGMKRDLDPYAAPTDSTSGLPSIGSGGRLIIAGQLANKPTQYRYQALIQRAKELTQQAQQLESVYLASLEKKDAETYTVLKAKQDLKLSKAGVKLSDYKLRTSENEVELAEIQRSRYELQVSELDGMINSALTMSELQLFGAYVQLAEASIILATLQANQTFSVGLTQAISYASLSGGAATAASTDIKNVASHGLSSGNYATQAAVAGLQAGFAFPNMNAQNRQTNAQMQISNLSLMASSENRQRDWTFQKVLAEKDIEISGQQIKIAQSRVKVSSQEKKMAEMQEQFAEESLEFLKNKFTNAQLYGWMSKVLGSAYASILNQATATAKMAEQQISFERQDTPPISIGDDYWEAPSMSVSLESTGGPDRQGLTGSYRLMQDLTRLDQWAFTEDKRKMEVSKSFSLAQKFPMEFQQLKLSGEMTFNTMIEDFDRDFPGQYMRIIRKVTVSVIALVPPVEGVKATLTHAGNSQVVIKGDRFQKATLRRQPEMIAFTNPENATGMLELQPMNPQMFNPFEGNGVAGMWQFEMEKESNFIDYGSIADVIVKIDYTCFHSFDYETIVRRNLDPEFRGERLYSFRNEFADQFYQLTNPDESATPFRVEVTSSLFDFPRNLKDVYIRGIRLMIAGEADVLRNTPKNVGINYREQLGDQPTMGVAALDKNNFAGTIGGGGTGLVNFLGKPANGYWEFDLNGINTSLNGSANNFKPLKELFNNGEISDILFVIDFAGSFN